MIETIVFILFLLAILFVAMAAPKRSGPKPADKEEPKPADKEEKEPESPPK